MFIKVTNEKDKVMHLKADQIVMIGEMSSTQPIFSGSVIGFQNGQTLIVKEKPKEVREWVEAATKPIYVTAPSDRIAV